MTIDEAIKVLEDGLEAAEGLVDIDIENQVKLVLEALKSLRLARSTGYTIPNQHLPSETEE